MYKFSCIFIIFIYLLPFTMAINSIYFLEYFHVLIILSAFFLGGLLSKPFFKNCNPQDYKNLYVPKFNILIFVFVAYLCFRSITIIEVLSQLYNGTYADWALSNAIKRYDGIYDLGIVQKIGTVFFITYAFLLGAYGARKNYLYLSLAFLFMIFIELSGLARAGALLATTALCVEMVIRFNVKLNCMKFGSYFKYGFLCIGVLILIFLFGAYFRVAGKENILLTLIDKFYVYTIAMYQALFIWMGSENSYLTTYGFNTFTSIFKLIGDTSSQGFYLPVHTQFGWTNIYTNIRGLLSDFGIIITILFYMTFGFLLRLYSFSKLTPMSYFFVRIILFFIIFILYSPFLFFTVFLSIIFSYLLIIIFMEENVLLHRRELRNERPH